ncbi:SH3 domain protein [Aphelenchoides besseyi]|nr:SH3 domain protein [Aphelenchoides besseyi]KAI6202332.1 SH3 domain protein [Aphelenchoides besseyi]
MQTTTMPVGRASTSFGIHKSDVPVTTIISNSDDNQNVDYAYELKSTEMVPCIVATSGRTTVFEAMPGSQTPTATKPRPLRVPQPPFQSLTQSPLHCATPSTSSLNTTTFPALPHPGSTSSLPAFQNLPPGVRHSAQPSLSSSTLPSYNQIASKCNSSTLPHRRPIQPMESINSRPLLNHINSSNSMSRAELMEIARRKQAQIDSNQEYINEMERQKAAFFHAKRQGLCAQAEIENLRQDIQRDEQTLERLGGAKRDVRTFSAMANQQRQLIHDAKDDYIGKEIDLRRAADRIHSLRHQRDLMHQRRAAAANAAIERQRRLNGMQKTSESNIEELYGQVNKPMVRPKASVGPFQVKNQISNTSIYEKPKPLPSYDEVDALRQLNRIPMRPTMDDRRVENELTENPWVVRTSAVDTFVLRSDSLKAAKRRSWAHDPQTRTHNSAHPTVAVPSVTANSSINSQPKRVLVTPTSAAIIAPVPTTKRSSIGEQTNNNDAAAKEPRKARKNLSSFTNWFGKRNSSKESKKPSTATVTPTPIVKATQMEAEVAEVLPKQEPLIPVEEQREIVTSPTVQSASTANPQSAESSAITIKKPNIADQKVEETLPDPPTTNSTSQVIHQSPLRCPLAAVDDDEEEVDEPQMEMQSPIPEVVNSSAITKQTTGATTIRLDNRAEEMEKTPDRGLSASPPEDPQMRDNESTASSADEDQTPVATETPPPLTSDEHRMLAATSEIMRQLNELEVDNVKVFDTNRTDLKALQNTDDFKDFIPAEYLIDEANRAATIIRQRHNRYDYDDDEMDDDLLQDDHGVQIRPYVVVERQNLDDEMEEDEERQTTTEEASSNDGESNATDEPLFDEISRPQLKGILKAAGTRKPKKKMIFDPLIIFLDAALEGELDLVTETATKIPDISQANEEGITALHNAICAGHYEIVKFLIEQHADVNAQDADGWTPLHCAASCNNLPLAKLLIENGACVFAMSLSDGETPAQKCEECINGYDGCAAYLESVDKCMGVINDKKIYASFSYQTERDDELSFEAGEELRVITRETGERGAFHQLRAYMYDIQLPLPKDCLWWLCENGKQERGLVPRNFFSLYPAWPHTQQHAVEPFELPPNAVALDSFLKKHGQFTITIGSSADDSNSSRRDSTATLDPCDGNQSSSGSPDSSASSDQQLRDQDSPPPLPKPKFDENVQISAHA